MQSLIIADIHSSFTPLERVFEYAERSGVKFCFVCGDITHFRSEDIFRFGKIIEKYRLECYVVHGNCDPPDSLKMFRETDVELIHCRSVEIGDYTFHGIGGSNFTPFDTPSEYSEDEFRLFISRFNYGERNILVSHCPPHGILDRTYSGMHAGCRVLREIMKNFDYIFCGHIHEARGIETSKPVVVNPGALLSGNFAIWGSSGIELMRIQF